MVKYNIVITPEVYEALFDSFCFNAENIFLIVMDGYMQEGRWDGLILLPYRVMDSSSDYRIEKLI